MDDGLPWNTVGRGRSREGAWIEIEQTQNALYQRDGRSREGAWIEMSVA